MLFLSSTSFLYTVNPYPSYRFRPSRVPNHINPLLSCKIEITLLWDNPRAVPICSNFKFWDCAQAIEERDINNILNKSLEDHIIWRIQRPTDLIYYKRS